MRALQRALALCALACLVGGAVGCAQPCAQVKQDYNEVLSAEQALVGQELSPNLASHFGLAVRLDLISRVASRLVGAVLSDALKTSGVLNISQSQALNFSVSGAPLDLRLEHDPRACAGCFRLQGDLGGSFTVELPVFGRQTVPLSGSFKFGAPILMKSLPDGAALVQLDLRGLADSAESFLTVDLKQLPSTWANALSQPLARRLRDHLKAQLEPLDLLTFRPPDLGLGGLRILPTQLQIMPEQRAFYIGFTSNLPGVAADAGVSTQQALALQDGEDISIVVQPSILLHVATLLMQEKVIPRQYNSNGEADESGSSFVTMNNFELGDAAQTLVSRAQSQSKRRGFDKKGSAIASTAAKADGRESLALGFRAWSLQGGPCFWFDSVIAGSLRLQNSELEVSLDDIFLTNSSLPAQLISAVNSWIGSAFAKESAALIKRSLTQPALKIPGLNASIIANSISLDARSMTLRAKLNL